jgi:hypothetical protein
MKDMMARLEKLRKDAAECELIRNLAVDRTKREMFGRLAIHLTMLAEELERAIAATAPPDSFLGHRTYERFPKPDDAD